MPDDPAQERESSVKIVWRLAWPAVALNSLQTLNSLLDSNFLGHLEPAAMTAVGGSTPLLFLLVSLSFALGTAGTAIVSRAYGAQNLEECREANRRSLGLAVFGGFALGLLAIPLASLLSQILLPPGDVRARELLLQYFTPFAFSLPAIFAIQALAGSLRGVGDTKSPLYISGLQIILHIVLNFLFIFPTRSWNGITIPGLGLGILGAGLSLTVSAWLAAMVYLIHAAKTPLGSSWRIRWPGSEWARRLLRIAVPAATMNILRVTSLMAFTNVLTHVPNGSLAVAALRPSFAIESFAFMPAFGLAIAASALVGQSLGMQRPDRAERLAWAAAHQAAIVSTVISVILFAFALPIANAILPTQPEVAVIASHYIMYICATEVLFAYAMVMIGAIQGAGDTVRPLWLTVFCMWIMRVPLAAILALPQWGPIPGLGMGSDGCWLAMSITQVVQGVLAILLFRQGAWKTQTV